MLSRANILLDTENRQLQKRPCYGIEASPMTTENIFEWAALISGAEGTGWEGGAFQLILQFSESYNKAPPKVWFLTIPFHPNIDVNSGSVRLAMLRDDKWSADFGVRDVLLAIQALLDEPVIADGLVSNSEAAAMYVECPHAYNQLVCDGVLASQKLRAGIMIGSPPPILFDTESASTVADNGPPRYFANPVSFKDYYHKWLALATTQEESSTRNAEPVKTALVNMTCAVQGENAPRKVRQYGDLVYGRKAVPRKIRVIQDMLRKWRDSQRVEQSNSNQPTDEINDRGSSNCKTQISRLNERYSLRVSTGAGLPLSTGGSHDPYIDRAAASQFIFQSAVEANSVLLHCDAQVSDITQACNLGFGTNQIKISDAQNATGRATPVALGSIPSLSPPGDEAFGCERVNSNITIRGEQRSVNRSSVPIQHPRRQLPTSTLDGTSIEKSNCAVSTSSDHEVAELIAWSSQLPDNCDNEMDVPL